MEKKLKNIQTFEQHTDKNLNISDVSDSNFTKKIVSEIKKDIENVIDKHQKGLDKETDENKKQFLRGIILGLNLSLMKLPLLETL